MWFHAPLTDIATRSIGGLRLLPYTGRVQRFKMLEVIWVNLEITFNVTVYSEILLLRFMS